MLEFVKSMCGISYNGAFENKQNKQYIIRLIAAAVMGDIGAELYTNCPQGLQCWWITLVCESALWS
jgi:hypothetical protein